MIPGLKSWINRARKDTALVIDISGDINPHFDDKVKIVYDPTNPDTITYNIFGYIDRLHDTHEQDMALDKLGLLIMPDNPDASEAGSYYITEGRKMLTASLIAFYHQGQDFIEICKTINSLGWQSLLNKIDRTQNDKAISYINSFEGVEDRFCASAKQACEEQLTLFVTDDAVAKTIRRPVSGEKSFEPCMIEDKNCFIVLPDSELEHLNLLSQILIAQCLDYFRNRPLNSDHSILFCLDEVASLGQVDLLPALRKFRKRKIRLFILTQSISDIDLTWGERQRKSMMTNFKYKIVLESSLPEEQEFWAKLVGYKTRISRSRTTGSAQSFTETEVKDYVMDPHEFANLGDSLVFLYPGGYYKLRKNYYFKNMHNKNSKKNTDEASHKESKTEDSNMFHKDDDLTYREALSLFMLTSSYTKEELNVQHKRLIKAFHPDNGGEDYYAARINAAYDILLSKIEK